MVRDRAVGPSDHPLVLRHHGCGVGCALGLASDAPPHGGASTPRAARGAPVLRRDEHRRWSGDGWSHPGVRARARDRGGSGDGGCPALLAVPLERRQGAAARRHSRPQRGRTLGGHVGPHRRARRLASALAGARDAPDAAAPVGGADRRRRCGRDRAGVAAADRRAAAVSRRLLRGGAARPPRRGLVPPRYDCRPHFRFVRDVPRAGGAALSVAELLCRARHSAPHHHLRRGSAEPFGDAARPVGRGAARDRRHPPAGGSGQRADRRFLATGSEERVLRVEPDRYSPAPG